MCVFVKKLPFIVVIFNQSRRNSKKGADVAKTIVFRNSIRRDTLRKFINTNYYSLAIHR